MGKRTLLNIWLAIALLALVWVVWQEPGHAPKEKDVPVKLTTLTPAAITKIAITTRKGSVTLDKHGGDWWLSEPIKIAANAVSVDNLLQVLQARSVARFPAAGRDLSQYGLADPEARLLLNDTEIRIGNVAPLGQQRYVQLGDTIHLIAERYMFDVPSDAASLVSRDLVPHGKRIAAIALPGAKLVRGDKGEWSMTPADKGIAADAIQGLVKQWSDVQALRVAAYQKQAAQGEVTIELEGESAPLRYQIVARQPELILARPEIGIQFYVAGEQAERLLNVTTAANDAAAANKK